MNGGQVSPALSQKFGSEQEFVRHALLIGFSWPGAAGADEAPTASEVTRRQCSPDFRAPLASFSAAMRNRPVLCFSGVELLTALSELRASSAGQVPRRFFLCRTGSRPASA